MKWVYLMFGFSMGAVGMFGILNWQTFFGKEITLPVVIREKPLEKYTIENLGAREYKSSIILEDPEPTPKLIKDRKDYLVQKFHFNSDGKKVTGLAHIPKACTVISKCPVVVQFRGYADKEVFTSGYGTARSAAKYAEAGFISIAPDFLGYGDSDKNAENVYESRFQTYTTALNLLAGIPSLPMADSEKVGIWGHSNGGHISLTVLEISGKSYPTTLWAPVSAPFPYSVLFYTYDSPDHGKATRKDLATFEEDYDTEQYALVNYLDRIIGTLQIHQGTADDLIPTEWTDDLVDNLKDKDKEVTYFKYPGADHNMLPDAWSTVVERDIEFFREKLNNNN